jgi:hypothetical protein
MNNYSFVDTDTLPLEVVLSSVRDEKDRDFIRSFLNSEYRDGAMGFEAKASRYFAQLADVFNHSGLDRKEDFLFCPALDHLKKYFDQGKLEKARTELYQRMIDLDAEILIGKWRGHRIEITKDDYITLYTIAGRFNNSADSDVLSHIPVMVMEKPVKMYNADDVCSLYLRAAVKYRRFDIFDKLFEGWTLLERLDYLGSFYDRGARQSGDKDINVLLPSSEEVKKFLSDWVKNLLNDKPSIETVQAFFPMLYKTSHYNASWFVFTLCRQLPEDLIPRIAEKAALFSPFEFFPVEAYNDSCFGKMTEIEFALFSYYCKLVRVKTKQDVTAIARYWHKFIEEEQIMFDYKNPEFWNLLDELLAPFFNEDLLVELLKIPEKLFILHDNTPCFYVFDFDWFAHFIALWLLRGKGKLPKKNLYERSIAKIKSGKYRHLPEAAYFALGDFLRTQLKEYSRADSENAYFLLYILYADGIDNFNDALSFARQVNEHCQFDELGYNLYMLAFSKSPESVREETILAAISPRLWMYYFREHPELFEQKILNRWEQAGDNFEERKQAIDDIYKWTSDAYIPPSEKFISQIVASAKNEDESKCLELHSLLEWNFQFRNDFQQHFKNFPKDAEWLSVRCSKFLNGLSKKQPAEWKNVNDCALYASSWLRQKSLWKALQPLLTAFRNAQKILVKPDLSSDDTLVTDIMWFFRSRDTKQLENLRVDMAAAFCRYLNPRAETKRDPSRYTDFDKAQKKDFRPDMCEPSPFWRYAYTRALADLEVISDGKGHFFKKYLEDALKAEPCGEVKKQLEKTLEKLHTIRQTAAPGHDTQRLFEAFWQLREAHAHSLGLEIDINGSKNLRNQEWKDRER